MPSEQKAERCVRLVSIIQRLRITLTVWASAIALTVTKRTVTRVTVMALLFIMTMPMASTIVMVWHDTCAE